MPSISEKNLERKLDEYLTTEELVTRYMNCTIHHAVADTCAARGASREEFLEELSGELYFCLNEIGRRFAQHMAIDVRPLKVST